LSGVDAARVQLDGAFDTLRATRRRATPVLEFEHGKPMRFSKDREKGVALGHT
jgi:hypothetical protein